MISLQLHRNPVTMIKRESSDNDKRKVGKDIVKIYRKNLKILKKKKKQMNKYIKINQKRKSFYL
eukprot:UN13516